MDAEPVVYLVDDDHLEKQALCRLLQAEAMTVRAFGSADEFLRAHDPLAPGCAVLDICLPGLGGLGLQRALLESESERFIVFMTGRGDVAASVQAMKAGAVDFLVKPFPYGDLVAAVRNALAMDEHARKVRLALASIQHCLDTLTPREHQVLSMSWKGASTSRSPPTWVLPKKRSRCIAPGPWRKWAPARWRNWCARPSRSRSARCSKTGRKGFPPTHSRAGLRFRRFPAQRRIQDCRARWPRRGLPYRREKGAAGAAAAAAAVSLPGGVGVGLQPRAYSAASVGTNFLAAHAAHLTGEVLTDPALPITDVQARIDLASIGYARVFGLAGRSASFGVLVPFVRGDMSGKVFDAPREVQRAGLGDVRLRFALNLIGAPALAPREFGRRAHPRRWERA